MDAVPTLNGQYPEVQRALQNRGFEPGPTDGVLARSGFPGSLRHQGKRSTNQTLFALA